MSWGHYPFSNGYELFGNRIFKPLMKSIYGYNYSSEIDPPLILSASLTQNQTVLIETSSSNLIAGSNNYFQLLSRITDDFILSNANGVSVNSFDLQGGNLILGLNGDPGTSAKISFIGKHSGTNNNIVNNEGLELVCFSDFPISGESNGNNNQETPALVFVNNNGNPADGVNVGKIYANPLRGASRDGNGNSNAQFGNIGQWSVDMVVSEESGTSAANRFGTFKDNTHPSITFANGIQWPLYQGSDVLTQDHLGMGALGWGSFGANAYNRSSGTGSVALGFNNIAGKPDVEAIEIDGGNIGQAVFGYASRATGNISFATGFRNTASGDWSTAMGYFNYATAANSTAIGKESYAQGASSIAIGYKAHAAGDGSVALGQENISWGSTNFTSGYQNIAGDVTAPRGTGGSAVAMGKYNQATADASMAFNRQTTATNQAATSMGFGTTADNLGMLAIGVNNTVGQGNTAANSYYNVKVNGGPGPGDAVGVAFVIGNGDVDVTVDTNTGEITSSQKGSNPSNAFMVKYNGDATLAGDLTVNSDARLKSNIISLGSTLAKLMKIDGHLLVVRRQVLKWKRA